MPADALSRSLARRLLTALGVLLAVGLAVAFLARAVGMAHREARFVQCRNDLKMIELALHNYHDTWNSFPPAVTYGPDGKPWHSWRVLINPFLESSRFYRNYRFEESWDGPNNRKLAAEHSRFSALQCPSDPDATSGRTSYLAVIGEGTMWPPDGAATLQDVSDGTSRVIHVVEVSNSGVHWMEPVDLRLEAMTFRIGGEGNDIRSGHVEGGWLKDGRPRANAGFADGHVGAITADIPPETLKSLLLRDDGGPEEVP